MNAESNNPQQPGVMSTSLIKNLIDNYRQNHLNAINTNLGIEDAHSIWFDLPKLKKFIATIEEEAQKTNPEVKEEDLGIRFYYASYPKIENWNIMDSHPVPKEYAEKHTLVLIPTLKKTNENGKEDHCDFNTLNANGGNNALGLSLAKKGGPIGPSDDDGTIGENSGTLIPPSPPSGESY
ncbi:hypothetical protein [Chryseobacterium sp. Mn2064]|uniref:hypothetical protein n=1 Tax=Chryseobacterium sp. Mn2064 TaxID=3395263 RepID=UPI003BD39D7D